MKTSMKTFFCKLATVVLVCFCTFQLNAQRSLTVPGGRDYYNPYGYNLYWDFIDGVLRIWTTDWENSLVPSYFKDEILPYKAYVKELTVGEIVEDKELLPTGSDHWGIPEGGVPMNMPLFNETPWYPIRELVRQIQIDGNIHTVGHFAFTYMDNLRSVILHEGVRELCTGAFNHCDNLAHIYFPSSLDYIGPLSFVPYPYYKLRPVELVCDLINPIELSRSALQDYYVIPYNVHSWCFNWIDADNSYLHLPSETYIPVFKDYQEIYISHNTSTFNEYTYYTRFKNILGRSRYVVEDGRLFIRTQSVVEGVDIVGGDITLAPTLNPKQQLSANLIPADAMTSTGRAGETSSGVTWNIGNYLSTDTTEDNIAKVTGNGGLLTFKSRGQTRVYVTTNSLGYYTYRNVYARDDEVTGGGIQITVENIYGTKVYGTTSSWKGKPTGMNTDVPEYSFNVPYEETVFNFRVDGVNESAHVDPKHATLRHMSTYTTDDQGVLIANTVIDTTFLVTVTAEYGNTFTWRINLHRENRDPALTNITVAGHKLIPEYNPNHFYYELPIKSKSVNLNVQAVPLIPNTEIFGTGTYKCANLGDTVINIISISENDAVNTYSIHVYNPANADLQSLLVNKGELEPAFDPSITEYTVNFPEYNPEVIISAKLNSTKATLINPEKFTLATGKTAYKVSVVSFDKSVQKDYTVTVNNPKRNYTDLLEEITVSVPNNTVFIDGDFEISAKCDPTSTLKGTGKFRAGSVPVDTTFIIKVTAEDRTVKEYPVLIHVVYPYGEGWRLSGNTLHIANRDWSQLISRFDQSPWYPYRIYIKQVVFDDRLRVIAPRMLYGCYNITELHLPSYLKEIGDNAFTGCDSLVKLFCETAIPPKVNNNTFLNSKGRHMGEKTALIIHGDAHSTYTYANYWRNFQHIQTFESNDATLKSLAVRDLNLTPAFNRDTSNYFIVVPRNCDLSRVIIDAKSADPDAQVVGQGILNPAYFQDTTFTVSVIAVNGVDKKQYKINIRRHGSDASLKSIKVNDLQLYPAFHKDTLNYVCIIPDSVETIRLSVEPAHKYTKLSYTSAYKIDFGKTTFNIRTVSEDGSQALLYKVTVVKTFYSQQNEERTTGTDNVFTTDVQAYVRNKVLHIDSPVSEQIAVYSVTGKLLRRLEKPAGKVTFALAGTSTGGVLILRGSSGWAQKVIN